jgi:hypothetical protein
MVFEVETSEKSAHRFRANTALQAKMIEDGHD